MITDNRKKNFYQLYGIDVYYNQIVYFSGNDYDMYLLYSRYIVQDRSLKLFHVIVIFLCFQISQVCKLKSLDILLNQVI